MPLYILDETKQALGGESLQHLQSRSLFLDRYAEPDSKEDVRKDWFSKMIGKSAVGESLRRSWLPASSSNLYARLRSRMMLNMSGGAMENANVCLDRYGIPYIPGSAIKGCARRAALAALHEWSETKTKPSGSDNAFTASCQPFKAPEAMLEAIADIFGWGDMDWKQGADFAWAMSSTECGLPARDPQSKGQGSRSKQFSGTIAFLPAYPNTDPTLELDVLTPHHGDYYKSEDPHAVAHDTENPVPCYFPSVKSQKEPLPDKVPEEYFTFPLLPLRNADPQLLGYARTWLKCGLETFGIGAKTAAGYGWFELGGKTSNPSVNTSTGIGSTSISDFSEKTFPNLVLNKLNPSQLDSLKTEIEKLKKPENSEWLNKLKSELATKEQKDIRKRLSGKDWFPKEWLPQTQG